MESSSTPYPWKYVEGEIDWKRTHPRCFGEIYGYPFRIMFWFKRPFRSCSLIGKPFVSDTVEPETRVDGFDQSVSRSEASIPNLIDRILDADKWKDYFISNIIGDIPDWLPGIFEVQLHQVAERMTFCPNVTTPLHAHVVLKSLEDGLIPASVNDSNQYLRDIAFLEYVRHGISPVNGCKDCEKLGKKCRKHEKHGMRYLLGPQGAEKLANKQAAYARETRSNTTALIKGLAQREAQLWWTVNPPKKKPTLNRVIHRLTALHRIPEDKLPKRETIWRNYLKEILPKKSYHK